MTNFVLLSLYSFAFVYYNRDVPARSAGTARSFTLTCGVFVAGRAVLAAQGLNPEAAEVPTEDNPEAAEVPTEDNPEAAEVSTQGTQSEDETAEPDVPRESSSSSAWSHADTLLLIDTYRKYRGMMRDPTKKEERIMESDC